MRREELDRVMRGISNGRKMYVRHQGNHIEQFLKWMFIIVISICRDESMYFNFPLTILILSIFSYNYTSITINNPFMS